MKKTLSLLTVVGARPQFVKAAAVSRAIAALNQQGDAPAIHETLVHTGQHYDANMSQVFFDELRIPRPDFNLAIGGGSHGIQTGQMLMALEKVLVDARPDLLLIYGDTNSTLAAALAAAKLDIPVAHVEAGLRSWNRKMPEEINRVMADHISRFLFCPTRTAVKNLRREGIHQGVYDVGDVMYDCALFYQARVEAEAVLGRHELKPHAFCLATLHRAENTDAPEKLGAILEGLSQVGSEVAPVVLPLHPRTKKCLDQYGFALPEHVRALPPLPYLEMVALQSQAKLILTDSGGVQKEACMFQTPCVTLREETEWVETVEAGCNRLAGSDRARIVQCAEEALAQIPGDWPQLYGDGRAAEKICRILLDEVAT